VNVNVNGSGKEKYFSRQLLQYPTKGMEVGFSNVTEEDERFERIVERK
jgi:hypothetical protein